MGLVTVALLALGLLLSAPAPVFAGPLPSVNAFSRDHGPAVVRVLPAGRAFSEVTGFLVGTRGVVVSVLAGARTGEAVVIELRSGERRRAKVVATDPRTHLSAIEVLPSEQEEPFPSLLLARSSRLGRADWLISLHLSEEGEVVASLGGVHTEGRSLWLLDLPCAVGSPILDEKGRVVAVATLTDGSHRVWAAPIDRVRSLLGWLKERQGRSGAGSRPGTSRF